MSEFLPPVVAVLTANIGEFTAKMAEAKAVAAETSAAGGGSIAKFAAVSKFALAGVAGAAVIGAAAAVKMGADFQESMTSLVTGAGESERNIKLVGDGILTMAGKVGVGAEDLAKGMYMVESAGFHGADGLKVLQSAAEGAKVGNADMGAVANAVTSVLNAYGLKGKDAASVTNQLIGTVASGKMHMDELAGSLGTIVPIAAALHVPFSEVGGAMATMTATGIDAHVAATNLRFSMKALVDPTSSAKQAMKDIGLSSQAVGAEMAKGHYIGALTMITDAAGKKFPVGSAQYLAAVSQMVGGSRGLQAALALTGKHLATVHKNQEEIAKSAHEAGGGIKGWSEVQKDFNTQVSQVVESIKSMAIRIGQMLIPYVEKAAHLFIQGAQWIMQHKEAMAALAAVIGGIVLAGVIALTAAIWSMTAALLANPITWIIVGLLALGAGIMWLWNNVSWFRDGVKAAWAAIGAAFQWLVGFAKSAWAGLQNGIAALGAWIRSWLTPLVAWWNQHWTQIKLVIDLVLGYFKIIFNITFNVLKVIVTGAMIGIRTVITVAMDIIKGVFQLAWTGISGTVRVVFNIIKGVVESGLAIVQGIVKAVTAAIHGDWSGAWQAIVDTFKNVFGIINSTASTIMSDLAETIQNAASGFINMLSSAGSDLISGLINGINSMIGAVISAVTDVANNIVGTIKSILHISSPSRVTHQVGQHIMEGLINGIVDKTKKAVETARDAVKQVRDAMRQDIAQVRNNIMQGGSITQGAQDGVGLITSFQRRVAQAKEFVKDIARLRGMGLNATSLREIIAAGPEKGGEIAQQLINSGKAGVAQVNSLEKQLIAAGTSLGRQDANAGYQKQLDTATKRFDAAVQAFHRAVALRHYYTIHHVLPRGWSVDDHNHLRYTPPGGGSGGSHVVMHSTTHHIHVHLNAREIQRHVIKQTNQYKVRNGATRLT